MLPLVSIGIVCWNSSHDLPSCLEALNQQNYPSLEIVIVDNNSQDDSLKIVSNMVPKAHLICNSINCGFCGGHNQGIRTSQGRYYMPLNPDLVMESGYISEMVSMIESNPRYGLAAGKLFLGKKDSLPRVFDSTGLFIDRKRRQYLRAHGELDTGQYNTQEEVFGVDGSAPLYRREMLEDISFEGEYFDETFFAHKEDVDLSWRARLFGWRCIFTPDAVAYHDRNFRPGKRTGIPVETRLDAVKNRYLLLLKNELSSGWRRDWFPILFYDLKIFLYLCAFERSSLAAYPRFLRLRSRAAAWRKYNLSHVRCDSSELLSWFK